jgi:hypothetical protein
LVVARRDLPSTTLEDCRLDDYVVDELLAAISRAEKISTARRHVVYRADDLDAWINSQHDHDRPTSA